MAEAEGVAVQAWRYRGRGRQTIGGVGGEGSGGVRGDSARPADLQVMGAIGAAVEVGRVANGMR